MSGKKGDPGSAAGTPPGADTGSNASSPGGGAGASGASTSAADEAAVAHAAPTRDVLFVRGASEDGRGLSVLRFSDDQISTGELREAKDGQPIVGELVSLTQRTDSDRLFDVSVLARGPGAPAPKGLAAPGKGPAKGPAKVATDAYRAGWESVFGARDKDAKPN